jgi:hypothetical protein
MIQGRMNRVERRARRVATGRSTRRMMVSLLYVGSNLEACVMRGGCERGVARFAWPAQSRISQVSAVSRGRGARARRCLCLCLCVGGREENCGECDVCRFASAKTPGRLHAVGKSERCRRV